MSVSRVCDHLLDRQAVHEHVEHRLLDRVGVQALRHRQVALRVEVDQEHLEALLRERHAQVQRRRRLRDTTLLVREHDHLRVRRGGHAGRPYIGTRKEAGKTHLRAPFLFRLPHSFCLLPKFRRSDAGACVALGARPRLGFRDERPQLVEEHARRARSSRSSSIRRSRASTRFVSSIDSTLARRRHVSVPSLRRMRERAEPGSGGRAQCLDHRAAAVREVPLGCVVLHGRLVSQAVDETQPDRQLLGDDAPSARCQRVDDREERAPVRTTVRPCSSRERFIRSR